MKALYGAAEPAPVAVPIRPVAELDIPIVGHGDVSAWLAMTAAASRYLFAAVDAARRPEAAAGLIPALEAAQACLDRLRVQLRAADLMFAGEEPELPGSAS